MLISYNFNRYVSAVKFCDSRIYETKSKPASSTKMSIRCFLRITEFVLDNKCTMKSSLHFKMPLSYVSGCYRYII